MRLYGKWTELIDKAMQHIYDVRTDAILRKRERRLRKCGIEPRSCYTRRRRPSIG